MFRRKLARRLGIAVASLALVAILAIGGLWWRLASGPISLDLATPWLAAAIAENFGGQQHVEVGGTQIERDDKGDVTLRLRDIVVRDRSGAIVASAPKAEVGISGSGLFSGNLRAETLRLVGAQLTVRVERDGSINVFAGPDKRPIAMANGARPTQPIASAAPPPASPAQPGAAAPAAPKVEAAQPDTGGSAATHDRVEWLTAVLAWIDGLGESGLDGHDLSELGLKNGILTVRDKRTNKTWKLTHIDVSLRRPRGGGIAFSVGSDQQGQRWSLKAVVSARKSGSRSMQFEAVNIPSKELLLALRMSDMPVEADLPLSARMRITLGPAGVPTQLQGAFVAQSGFIGDPQKPRQRVKIDRAMVNFEWDIARRVLVVPIHIISGGNRFTLLGQIAAPRKPGGQWLCQLGGGSIVLAGPSTAKPTLALDRILMRVSYDPGQGRIQFEQGELGNAQTGIAFSGVLDTAGQARLTLGIAARPMALDTFMRLWPPLFSPEVRDWVRDHVLDGSIDRADIAINSPVDILFDPKRHVSDDALSIGIAAHGAVLRPLETLPAIGDAAINVHVTGRTARVAVDQANVQLPSGRKLSISNAAFEVANTAQEPPLSQTRMQVEGPLPAVAELMKLEPLRSYAATNLIDPASSRGNVTARVTLGIPLMPHPPTGTTTYSADIDLSRFSAENVVMGHRLEADDLHLLAENGDLRVDGLVKIGGLPASLQYRQQVGVPQSELQMDAVLDDAARRKLGLDFGRALTGPVPIKVSGTIGSGDAGGRLAIDADLTQASLDNLMPGWVKAAGKPARARFTLVPQKPVTRFDDFTLQGSGVDVRGSLVLDSAGSIVSADFPVFSLSPRDRASLKVDRKSDGMLRVVLRGDVYDATQFLRDTATGSSGDEQGGKDKSTDLDLEVKMGTVAGFHVETLRSLDLKLVRKAGRMRSFALSAKLGRNASLTGDLRAQRSGRPGLTLVTDDAGAFLRFANIYSRVYGGDMTVTMDPPRSDHVPQDGVVKVSNFVVRGEAALDRVVAGAPSQQRQGVQFSSLEVNFTRAPGRLTIREGVVRGPIIGATLDGTIDYRADTVRARGVLVPLYSVNNLFGQLPIVGFFLGGGFNSQNEGLLGINYQVVGSPGAPELLVNPVSAVAPGIIRKLIPNLFNVPTQPNAQQPSQGYPPAYSDTSR